MKYNRYKSLASNPIKRVVSLFITVIWLATILQPCVMASVVDLSSSKVESHHTSPTDVHSNHVDNGADSDKHGCSHCDTFSNDENHCDSEANSKCDNKESYVYSERIKPIDHEKFSDPHQPLKLLINSDYGTQIGQLVASEIGKSPPSFQGPTLTDLYQIYLK